MKKIQDDRKDERLGWGWGLIGPLTDLQNFRSAHLTLVVSATAG